MPLPLTIRPLALLGSLIRSLLQPPSRNPLRLIAARAKQRAVLARLRDRGIKPLYDLPVSSIKRSDRLYVLGSGASVLDYDEAQWEEIAAHDSVGFNSWIAHDFVPTFYVMEYLRQLPSGQAFMHNLALREAEYAGVPLLFQYRGTVLDGAFIEAVPEALRDGVYMIPQLPLPGRDAPELRAWVRALRRLGLLTPARDHVEVVFSRAASVALLTMLGAKMGYSEIVLCGVDLNNTAYFYEVEQARYEAAGRAVPQSGQVPDSIHKTNDPARVHGGVPIEEVLAILDQEWLRPAGITLSIGSRASALYPAFPYHWEQGA